MKKVDKEFVPIIAIRELGQLPELKYQELKEVFGNASVSWNDEYGGRITKVDAVYSNN